MSETKLLPCPFCGGEAIDYKGQVVCGKCYCGTGIMDTPKEAIELWNTRKPIDDTVERLQEKDDDCGCGKNSVWEAIDIVRNAGKDGAE